MIEKNNFLEFLENNHPDSIQHLRVNSDKVAIFEHKGSPFGKNGELSVFYFGKFNYSNKNVSCILSNDIYKIIINF